MTNDISDNGDGGGIRIGSTCTGTRSKDMEVAMALKCLWQL